MKDIVIRKETVARELWILLGCFVATMLVNAGAIIAYHRPWYELFTQVGFVVSITVSLYLILWVVRLIVLIIKKLFIK